MLKSIYYDSSHPAAFAGAKKLFHAAKEINPSIKYEEVEKWLSGELTYTLHKQARRKFSREKIVVSSEYEQYQADLVDMNNFSSTNKSFKYILTVIDCFSRYAFAIPIKNKKAESIKNALKEVFKYNKPCKLQTDRGKEFLNSIVQNYLKSLKIHFFTTQNTTFKCAIVERFNRTLKSKMFKYFSSVGNRKYLDVLPKIIESYNNTVHRTIKMSPNDVNETNEKKVFQNIYGFNTLREYLLSKNKFPKLEIGSHVRRKYELNAFDKGYYPNWTDNTYTISKAIKGSVKPMYKIKDSNDRTLPQKFYPEEIQKITSNLYRIQEILRPETRFGKKGFIVKWLNYSSEHNSWVPSDEIKSVNGGK